MRLCVKMTPLPPPQSGRHATALADIAAVVGVACQINGVVGGQGNVVAAAASWYCGQGNVGQAADEAGRVLAQRAEHDVVHATCAQRHEAVADIRVRSRADATPW